MTNDLFIEETIEKEGDFQYKIIWRGGTGSWDEAFRALLSFQSANRLELWSKIHAEGPEGFAPMAFRDKNSKKVMVGNTLKMLMSMNSVKTV